MRLEGLPAAPSRDTHLCVCTALHASRLSHSEPPSATPSPALSVESLASESSSQPPSTELLEPPVVPKSCSEPAVHAPGTPGTSASLSANSSLSSSGELAQPSVDRTPQASPGLAPSARGSPGPPPAKPCSGAAPTPLLLVEDKSPAPSPGTSSPQLQVKVSASPSPKLLSCLVDLGLVSGQEYPGPCMFTDLSVPIYPFSCRSLGHSSISPSCHPLADFLSPVDLAPGLGLHVLRHLTPFYPRARALAHL